MPALLTAKRARFELARRAARRSLRAYVKAAWPVLNPVTPLAWGWAQDAMCDHIQAWVLGEIQFLLVEVPPGSSKSTIGSRCAPAWSWQAKREGLSPSMRWMCGSYNQALSNALNSDRKLLIESERLRYLLGCDNLSRLAKGAKNKTFFKSRGQGFMLAMTPGGEATGFHCDRMILDDIIKPGDVSPAGLTLSESWQRDTLPTRFGDLTKQAVMLEMQRLGVGDPADIFADMYPDCVRLTIPAQYDPKRSCVTVVAGRRWEDPRTEEGESFEPERFPVEEVLEPKRHQMGDIQYATQFQQSPVAEGGNMIPVGHFRRHTVAPPLDGRGVEVIGTVDCSFSGAASADYVAAQVWAYVPKSDNCPEPRIYLLDQMHGHMGAHDTKEAIDALSDRWSPRTRNPIRWLVEAGGAGVGDAIVEMLRREGVLVKPVTYKRNNSKEQRGEAGAVLIRSRVVSVPKDNVAPWARGFIEECEGFPMLRHDDQVDAMSMALLHFRRKFDRRAKQVLVDVDDHREQVGRVSRAKDKRKRFEYRT